VGGVLDLVWVCVAGLFCLVALVSVLSWVGPRVGWWFAGRAGVGRGRGVQGPALAVGWELDEARAVVVRLRRERDVARGQRDAALVKLGGLESARDAALGGAADARDALARLRGLLLADKGVEPALRRLVEEDVAAEARAIAERVAVARVPVTCREPAARPARVIRLDWDEPGEVHP
jgi:hypothetical protein